jgi:very-short-patch-repair endonuclease
MNRIHYNPALKEKARQLRNNSTLSEVLLWNKLKNGQMCGYDFHRQKPILNYIVDFFCHKLNLVIEIDGDSHIGKEAYDIERQVQIESLELNFLRFTDLDVKTNMIQVIERITAYIEDFEKSNKTPPEPP